MEFRFYSYDLIRRALSPRYIKNERFNDGDDDNDSGVHLPYPKSSFCYRIQLHYSTVQPLSFSPHTLPDLISFLFIPVTYSSQYLGAFFLPRSLDGVLRSYNRFDLVFGFSSLFSSYFLLTKAKNAN